MTILEQGAKPLIPSSNNKLTKKQDLSDEQDQYNPQHNKQLKLLQKKLKKKEEMMFEQTYRTMGLISVESMRNDVVHPNVAIFKTNRQHFSIRRVCKGVDSRLALQVGQLSKSNTIHQRIVEIRLPQPSPCKVDASPSRRPAAELAANRAMWHAFPPTEAR